MSAILIGIAGLVALTASALWFLQRRLLVVTVSGTSMEPTLRNGDRVLVRRAPAERIQRGDVVVLAGASKAGGALDARLGEWRMKRVAALPGEAVPADLARDLKLEPGAIVPVGAAVLLGDNAREGYDSRQAGFFPTSRLVCVVLRRISGRRTAAPKAGQMVKVRPPFKRGET